MLIKENRLRSIIRSIIKEAIGPKRPRPDVYDQMGYPENNEIEYDDRPNMPKNLAVSSFSSWDDDEMEDSDYYESEEDNSYDEYEAENTLQGDSEIYNSDVNTAGQASWEMQNPGSEPVEGEVCNDGRYEYMYDSDGAWIKTGRVNSNGRRR